MCTVCALADRNQDGEHTHTHTNTGVFSCTKFIDDIKKIDPLSIKNAANNRQMADNLAFLSKVTKLGINWRQRSEQQQQQLTALPVARCLSADFYLFCWQHFTICRRHKSAVLFSLELVNHHQKSGGKKSYCLYRAHRHHHHNQNICTCFPEIIFPLWDVLVFVFVSFCPLPKSAVT